MRSICITTIILAIGLAGCSTGGSRSFTLPTSAITTTQSSMRTTGATLPQAVYVANFLNKTVDVFAADGELKGTITGLDAPAGLFLDGDQNLWVADQTKVLMFKNGQYKPSRTLRDFGGSPDNISVAKNGTVYVTNFFNSNVGVYAPGSDIPTAKLHVPRAQYTTGVAHDADGNVFVTYNDNTYVGRLEEFIGGTQTGLKPLPPRFSWAADIKIDDAGNLLILDSLQLSVTEFTRDGYPTGLSFSTYVQWNAFDITRDQGYIAGTTAMPDHDLGVLKTFPAGTRVQFYDHRYNGGISGIALAPGHFQ